VHEDCGEDFDIEEHSLAQRGKDLEQALGSLPVVRCNPLQKMTVDVHPKGEIPTQLQSGALALRSHFHRVDQLVFAKFTREHIVQPMLLLRPLGGRQINRLVDLADLRKAQDPEYAAPIASSMLWATFGRNSRSMLRVSSSIPIARSLPRRSGSKLMNGFPLSG
jgi:hypothetical protein